MNITKEQIDDLNATIQIEITTDDYQEKFETKLREYRKKANMPGFRPGNVPMGIIKKMYGNAALIDIIDKLTSESLYNYIKENDLNVLGSPLHNEEKNKTIDFDLDKSFSFFFDIALNPQFDLNLEKTEINFYKIKVDDDYVNKQIDSFRKNYGNDITPEASNVDDRLFGKFEELNKKNEIIEGGITNSASILPKMVSQNEALIGLKIGDKINIDIKKTFENNDTEIAYVLNIDKEKVADISSKFSFTVEEIHRIEPAELNEEFYKKIFPYSDIKTEEDFKVELKHELERQTITESEKKFIYDVQKYLLEQSKVQLPDAFMKRWILTTSEDKNISKEKIEEDYDKYADSMKWQLIENKLIKDNEIQVTEQDITNHVMSWFNRGNEEVTPEIEERSKQFVATLLKNKEESKRIYDKLYDDKMLALYKDKIKVTENEINLEDFIKLA